MNKTVSSFLIAFLTLLSLTEAGADNSLERIHCNKPSTQAHKLICDDPYLKDLAKNMARSYSALRQRLVDQAKPALDKEQAAWVFFRDSDCDTAFNKPFKGPQKKPKRLCLTSHMEARLVILETRLSQLGRENATRSASLKKATELLPFGAYKRKAQHGEGEDQIDGLLFKKNRILVGDKLCLYPAIRTFGIENYFFFKNNFGIKDPGLFDWPNRAGSRSLAIKIHCRAGDLGYAGTFLIGKPGRIGLLINKTQFLIFEKD